MLGMTPHFTVRVWGSPGQVADELARLMGEPRKRVPVAEIEIDSTERGQITIVGHRGLDYIPQKMLDPVPEQPTLWHQEER